MEESFEYLGLCTWDSQIPSPVSGLWICFPSLVSELWKNHKVIPMPRLSNKGCLWAPLRLRTECVALRKQKVCTDSQTSAINPWLSLSYWEVEGEKNRPQIHCWSQGTWQCQRRLTDAPVQVLPLLWQGTVKWDNRAKPAAPSSELW